MRDISNFVIFKEKEFYRFRNITIFFPECNKYFYPALKTFADVKPLWLEEDYSTYTSNAIIGIDKDLKLITKKIED